MSLITAHFKLQIYFKRWPQTRVGCISHMLMGCKSKLLCLMRIFLLLRLN